MAKQILITIDDNQVIDYTAKNLAVFEAIGVLEVVIDTIKKEKIKTKTNDTPNNNS